MTGACWFQKENERRRREAVKQVRSDRAFQAKSLAWFVTKLTSEEAIVKHFGNLNQLTMDLFRRDLRIHGVARIHRLTLAPVTPWSWEPRNSDPLADLKEALR